MKSPLYYKTCLVLEKLNDSNSFKNTIYNIITPEDHYFKKVYCLSIEVKKNIAILDDIVKKEFSDEYKQYNTSELMLKILLYEIFLSPQKLKMGGRVIKYIKSKSDAIKLIVSLHKGDDFIKDKSINNDN